MSSSSATLPAPRCLLFVVRTAESMLEKLGCWPRSDPPVLCKLAAASLLVNQVIDRLLHCPMEATTALPSLDVGVLVYSRDDSGTEVRPLLPGASPESPLVSLEVLRSLVEEQIGPGQVRQWVSPEVGGEVPATTALCAAHAVVLQWLYRNPSGSSPLVVHITDGRNCGKGLARIGRSLRALATPCGNVGLLHCGLTSKILRWVNYPASATNIPGGPWKRLFRISSPITTAGPNGKKTTGRGLSINALPVKRIVGLLRHQSHRALEEQSESTPLDAAGSRLKFWELRTQKGGSTPEECEDACAVNEARSLAAISDGAGSGIFSRSWAKELVGFVFHHPLPTRPDALEVWLQECRQSWFEKLNYHQLRYTQQMKVQSIGSGGTLLALQLDQTRDLSSRGIPESYAWLAWAVGDDCLFWIRNNRLHATFPAVCSADFGLSSVLLQTRSDIPLVPLILSRGVAKRGDFFLLATDAIAQLLLRRCELGSKVNWEEYWNVDQEGWIKRVELLREQEEIVNDDCTLLAVQLAQSQSGAGNKLG